MPQPGLFDIANNTSVLEIFPEFTIESPAPVASCLTHDEMRHILRTLGFVVGEMYTHQSEVLVFPRGPATSDATLFRVTYPNNWSVTDDLSSAIYYGDYNPVRQILDGSGKLRGIIHCSLDRMPERAIMYTRYAVLSGTALNFAKGIPIEAKSAISLVVDRSAVLASAPFAFPVILHMNRRNLLLEAYPALEQISSKGFERLDWIEKNIPQGVQALLFQRDAGEEWLTERFPDWRNPAAYWE